MAKTLLQQAKDIRVSKHNISFTEQELEVVEAWLADEIQLTQIMKALKITSGRSYVWLALGAREIWRNKK